MRIAGVPEGMSEMGESFSTEPPVLHLVQSDLIITRPRNDAKGRLRPLTSDFENRVCENSTTVVLGGQWSHLTRPAHKPRLAADGIRALMVP
jgi:hypothetical protein